MMTRLFVVDDHYMVIEGLRSLLEGEKDIEWMGHATNAASCLSFLKLQQPDVILMDVNLPDMNGTALCKNVRQKYPMVFVIGLSTFNQGAVIKNMMDNGASGYVLKNATREELLSAIAVVVSGKSYLSTEASLSMRQQQSALPVAITRREKEVLALIADGLTNTEIAEKLFISIPTVNTHRKSLLEKFDAKNTATLIKIAVQKGLV